MYDDRLIKIHVSFVRKVMTNLIVAAIDFGTTFSGYAFSFVHQYMKDPLKISLNTWTAGSGGVMSLKTSTCVLFDPKGEFHSFGYDAEDKYSDLALDNIHHDWYYFRRFKMTLYKRKVCLLSFFTSVLLIYVRILNFENILLNLALRITLHRPVHENHQLKNVQ